MLDYRTLKPMHVHGGERVPMVERDGEALRARQFQVPLAWETTGCGARETALDRGPDGERSTRHGRGRAAHADELPDPGARG